MRAMVNVSSGFVNATSQSLEKWNDTSLVRSKDNRLAILLKSFLKPDSKKATYVLHTSGKGEVVRFVIKSTFNLSTFIPL